MCRVEETETHTGSEAESGSDHEPLSSHQVVSPAGQISVEVVCAFSQQLSYTLEFTGLCSRTQPWELYLPRNPKAVEQTLG